MTHNFQLTDDQLQILTQALIYAKPVIIAVNEIPADDIADLYALVSQPIANLQPVLYADNFARDYYRGRK